MNNEKTATFKLEVSTTTKTFKEIALPYFIQNEHFAYKILSQTTALAICRIDGYYSIELQGIAVAFGGTPGVECTEEVFNEIYNTVSDKLKSL